MMDEEGAFDNLSSEENHAVWDETERKFWEQFSEDQKTWRDTHEQRTKLVSAELRVELSRLTGQRNALADTQARLARELAEVEDELRLIAARWERKTTELEAADDDYRAQHAAQAANWEHQARTMTNFFRKKRGQPPLDDLEPVANGFHNQTLPIHQAPRQPQPADASASRPDSLPAQPIARLERPTNGARPTSATSAAGGDRLVDVVDADGNVIGPVQRIEPWNQWVSAVLKLPIQRPVKIRRGRRFNEEHLSTIYERAEAKGVKWLSCMIQAIGTIQSKRCQSCDKNQGAFEHCIIVGGDLLQKCGNCEWNRQGCHGASGETIDIPAAEREAREREEREARERREQGQERDVAARRPADYERLERADAPPRHEEAWEKERRHREILDSERARYDMHAQQAPASRPTTEPTATSASQWTLVRPAPSAAAAPAPIFAATANAAEQARRAHGLADRDILIGHSATPPPPSATPPPVGLSRGPLPIPPIRDPRDLPFPPTSGFTPANQRGTPPSRESVTPVAARVLTESPPQARPGSAGDGGADASLPEINRDNLVLRHDGNVFTYPECMVGVPVAKIHPGHPYWDPDWKDVRAEILEARERWRQKHQATIEAEARNEKTGSSKYQIGRQVNRGTKILEFLDDENQISPYQLLAKKFMHSSKGGITSYDTLFRLCETLSELSKFHLDIPPVDWMRHRLHEIMTEKGGDGVKSFNLPKIVHDFYHDPKLTMLRHKHGFKNIGRPSGQQKGSPAGRTSFGSSNGGTPKPKKRKSTASLAGGTPREYTYIESPLANQMVIHDEGPYLQAKSQAAKRPKYDGDLAAPRIPSFRDLAAISDSDRVASGPALRREDFELRRVQSRLKTTASDGIQYWSWAPERRSLEHRVLKRADPPEWGPIGDPHDFDLRPDEAAEMQYDLESNRVYIFIPAERDTSHVLRWRRRGDMMVEPKDPSTLKRFLSFCETLRMPIKELAPGTLSRWDDFRAEQPPEREPESSHAMR